MRSVLKLIRHADQFVLLARCILERRGLFMIPEGSPLKPIDVAAVLRQSMPGAAADYGMGGGKCYVTLTE